MRKMIFIVDDSDTNLTVANEALKQDYDVMTFTSAERLFAVLEKIKPDLILLDIEMPKINGFDTIKRLKSNDLYADIPVMFLTGRSDVSNEAYGIELGAVDFIAKPFSKPVLLNRIKYHLHIDEIFRERTKQLLNLQNGIMFSLAELVESRDKNTGGHIERTAFYAGILVNAMMERNVYYGELCDWNIDLFVSSTRLHDLGKIIIPGSILNKPGLLTKDEFEIIKTHVAEGVRIVDRLIDYTGCVQFLNDAKLLVASHHERWDGNGYPRNLKQREIPLQGRIMSIIDVYDALVSERPYKLALTEEEAFNIIQNETGRRFDPYIASVFIDIKDRIMAEHAKIKNSPTTLLRHHES